MTRAFIDDEEWDGCYSAFSPPPDRAGGLAIDVDDEIWARWMRVQAEWEACQDEMRLAAEHMAARRADRTERGERIVPTWPPGSYSGGAAR